MKRKTGMKRAILAVLTAGMLIAGMPAAVFATSTDATNGSSQTNTSESNTSGNSSSQSGSGSGSSGSSGSSSSGSSSTSSSSGTGYIALGSTYVTPSVSAGQTVTLYIPIVNYNFCPLTNVVVAPIISNKVTEWPFESGGQNYTQTIPYMGAYSYYADVNATAAIVPFTFKVRDDVLTGFYPISFEVTYLPNGESTSQSKTTITAYVQATGKAGSGRLEDNLAVSKPRLIVTGFETSPADVNAGDTFTITVHVKNTSETIAVSNVLFNLQSDSETTTTSSSSSGSSSSSSSNSSSTTYAAFLPTSGSSAIYESSIAPGQTVDLALEMSARADLTQKPYVLNVNTTYDAAGKTDITDKASVSIPVWQKSKFDTGEESVSPERLGVGENGNVSFAIYNTGRTTLNNVWFRFRDENVTGDDVFVGTITSGSTGYVDASFVTTAPNDGKIHAIVDYEDDRGNVTTVEKEFALEIEEGFSAYMEAPPENLEEFEQTTTFPTWAKILIIVGIVAAGAVAVVMILRKVKEKKKEKELEDDITDDEEDLTEEQETATGVDVTSGDENTADTANTESGSEEGNPESKVDQDGDHQA